MVRDYDSLGLLAAKYLKGPPPPKHLKVEAKKGWKAPNRLGPPA